MLRTRTGRLISENRDLQNILENNVNEKDETSDNSYVKEDSQL